MTKTKPKQGKKHFEANMLDGDPVNDCGGAMLSARSVWEYINKYYELKQGKKEAKLWAARRNGKFIRVGAVVILYLSREEAEIDYADGVVRQAFADLGHDATSCDFLPTEMPGNHYQGDVRDILLDGWDMMIAHPPCTHLAVSGSRWFKYKQQEQKEALEFVQMLMDAPIERVAIENPVSVISSKIRKPDQIVNPWMFGHMEQKKTCLWLKGLPKLKETNNVYVPMMDLPRNERERIHYLPPSKDRWKERSKTYQGLANAMASQWSF